MCAYAQRVGVNLAPDHFTDNHSMTFSLVASTKGVSLLPLYARNLLPPTVVVTPLSGAVPSIDLAMQPLSRPDDHHNGRHADESKRAATPAAMPQGVFLSAEKLIGCRRKC